jgi:hypothetical protein
MPRRRTYLWSFAGFVFVLVKKEKKMHVYIFLVAFGGRLALGTFLLISVDSRKVAPTIHFELAQFWRE